MTCQCGCKFLGLFSQPRAWLTKLIWCPPPNIWSNVEWLQSNKPFDQPFNCQSNQTFKCSGRLATLKITILKDNRLAKDFHSDRPFQTNPKVQYACRFSLSSYLRQSTLLNYLDTLESSWNWYKNTTSQLCQIWLNLACKKLFQVSHSALWQHTNDKIAPFTFSINRGRGNMIILKYQWNFNIIF